MRGKDYTTICTNKTERITPAYAGKSSNQSVPLFKLRDHPRLCGEKYQNRLGRCDRLGSPPPMRGKAARLGYSQMHCRITPAYAGKSIPGRSIPDLLGGSPPPMRGKGLRSKQHICQCQDHPRLCGEKGTSQPL